MGESLKEWTEGWEVYTKSNREEEAAKISRWADRGEIILSTETCYTPIGKKCQEGKNSRGRAKAIDNKEALWKTFLKGHR